MSIDLLTAGDGLLTLDTETSLEWLDVTRTNNMSYNQVVAQLAVGGSFHGFQVANSSAVQTLFLHGGWSGSFNVEYDGDHARYLEATSIVALLGNTTFMYLPQATYGLVSDTNGAGAHYYDVIFAYDVRDTGSASINTFAKDASKVDEYIGTYLYRAAAIPEPSTGLLVIAGLAGMAARRRRT